MIAYKVSPGKCWMKTSARASGLSNAVAKGHKDTNFATYGKL